MQPSMHVIAIGNQKGGVAKTTTAATLGVVLSRAGIRVHLIDMDPQASLTSAFGRRDKDGYLYDALSFRKALPVIEIGERLTITPSSKDLERGSIEFMAAPGREFILKDCLGRTPLPEKTVVIIDSPPSLNVLAYNCLTAANSVLVVVKPGGFELQALAQLRETVQILGERINPNLRVIGAILTEVDMRESINQDVAEEVGKFYPVLGWVRKESQLKYATTGGYLHELEKSKALDDYKVVAGKIREVLQV